MKKIITLIVAVIMVAALAIPSFAATAAPSIDTEAKLINTEASTDTVNANLDNASDKPTRADMAAFKSAFSDLFTQLEGLRATARQNWATIKTVNAEIKKAMTDYKASISSLPTEERKAKVKALSETLKPLHDSVKSIHASIRAIRETKRAQWSNYRRAVKAKDQAGAEAALRSIISLKSEIIAKQNELMTVKQQILSTIKQLLPATV